MLRRRHVEKFLLLPCSLFVVKVVAICLFFKLEAVVKTAKLGDALVHEVGLVQIGLDLNFRSIL